MSARHVHPDVGVIRTIEGAMARNLRDYVAAYREVVPHAGSACIDVAGGVAAFTGIGSPLTTVKGAGPEISPSDLQVLETFFRHHAVAAVTIELAPWLSEESKQILAERGYGAAGQEDVVATTSGGTALTGTSPRTSAIPVNAWREVMRRSSDLSEDSPTSDLITAAAHLPQAHLYGIRDNHRWIASAQSVTYDDVVILGNDGTVPEARRSGAQTALIDERVRALPAGKIVAAEVAPGSGSERNYLRCGFQIAYTRTHHVRTLG
jgi:hypothetical protein